LSNRYLLYKETRAFYFAAPAIIMSIEIFAISFKQNSILISVLLVINGIILTVDGIVASYNYPIAGYFASQAAGFILALVVFALGIVRA
jgi:hypothetical protein